uniref:Ig-like domain-containing protein n=1 Tax=Pygocentrus nattereri TaxID=42514 RepID=A0A3B4E3H7_PYGNA
MMFLCSLTVFLIMLSKLLIHAREDETVTLSCQYEGSMDSLQWYRQYPGSRPEYLLLKYRGSTDVTRADPTFLRLDKFWNLSLSSTAVSDSALYYCAMRPTVTGNPATLHDRCWLSTSH